MIRKIILTALVLIVGFSGSAFALTEVSSFGDNPGNLTMYKHVPSNMPSNAPLVVVLHGCTQSASSYNQDTGWDDLADREKFYVVYPQQSSANNMSKCFNWFQESDYERGKGEAKSIISMVDKMKSDYSIDSSKVFVTGVSAGGCMTCNVMASYPDVFAGGAPMAGIAYGCATGMMGGLSCMNGTDKSPDTWGDYVRDAYPEYSGPYPVCSVFHGDKDSDVAPMWLTEIMEQWTNVHGADQTPEVNKTFRTSTQKVYEKNGVPVVETYMIHNMSHGITVDPGSGEDQGGSTGSYSHDKDIWSSYYAAKFWGIIEDEEPDTTPPTVDITNPADGDEFTIGTTVTIAADAADINGVTKVEFYVDDSLKSTDSAAPYEHEWDTTGLSAGNYDLMAKAYDPSDNIGVDDDTTVSLASEISDTTPPTVDITNPADGDEVGGKVKITADALDAESGVTKVEFYVDDSLKSTDSAAPYEYDWDTSGYDDQQDCDLKAKAYDVAGNSAVDDDTTVTVVKGIEEVSATFENSGSKDGYVKAYTDGSGRRVGYLSNLGLGAGGDYKKNNAILHFDTSSIPDDATVTRAFVQIESDSGSGDPWEDGQNALVVDVKTGYFGSSETIQKEDWDAAATASEVGTIGCFQQGSQRSANIDSSEFNQGGLDAINKTGTTQVRLRFDPQPPGSYKYLFVKQGSAAKLYVTYTVAGSPPPPPPSSGDLTAENSGSKDGYVKAYTDGSGREVGSFSNLGLGAGGDYKKNNAILHFDTSSIPDDTTVTRARVYVEYSSGSGDPWQNGSNDCVVDVKTGYFGSSETIQKEDWDAAPTASEVATIGPFGSGGKYSSDFNQSGEDAINKTGVTQVRLRFDPQPSGLYEYLFIEQGANAKLCVDYE